MKIEFSGHEFVLHSSGALYWPLHKLLIVSDAHLEKGSWFARWGFHLPPYDSHQTLMKVMETYTELEAEKILILGDFFHDSNAHLRLSAQSADLFADLQKIPLIWIKGNHDIAYIPDNVEVHNEYTIENIVFRHEASPLDDNEISGHFHPKDEFIYKGQIFRGRCFIEDGKKFILPAFGAYTGGLSVKDKIFRKLFADKVRKYIIINNKVISSQNIM